jgi:hypothetical protein
VFSGVFAGVVLTHAPFFPADSPAGHFTQSRSLQIGRRKSASAGFSSGSWQGPSRQIPRRRSASEVLLSFSFVPFLGGTSPIRGDATILSALPEAWLSDELGIVAAWLSGILTRLGLLGALLCDALGTEEALEVVLNEMLDEGPGARAGGGVLGAALGGGLGGGLLGVVEECCAKTGDENNITPATTRPESRITHLLPTAGDFAFFQHRLSRHPRG